MFMTLFHAGSEPEAFWRGSHCANSSKADWRPGFHVWGMPSSCIAAEDAATKSYQALPLQRPALFSALRWQPCVESRS